MKTLNDISVQYVKGVGPSRKKTLERLGIETVEDLFYFFPRRYEDRRDITSIAQTKIGEGQTIHGQVVSCDARKSWHTKKHVTEVVIDDQSGRLVCVWFNQPYLSHYFKVGKKAVCHGKVDVYKNRLQMVSPEYEIIEKEEDEELQLSRIVPIYPLTRGITQRFLRKIIKAALDKYLEDMPDELPVPLRNKIRLYNIRRSVQNTHFPENFEDQEEALKRISFEEFFFFQISIILRRLSLTQKPGVAHAIDPALPLKYIHAFPFELTAAQTKVMREIVDDMSAPKPMLRLLQGDVGCGKTLVAVFGCLAAFHNGHQSCVMAPTEILARQHYATISSLACEGGPLANVRVALLISSLSAKEKSETARQIKEGGVDLVVGTHALISDAIVFKDLSYAVIDEQHKFGVRQRALLAEKGRHPDILIMTATPIPRTLCITLYGDLDVSVIDEMPPGRGRVKTVLYSEEQSDDVYGMVKEKVGQGQQAYFIYPVIEESAQADLNPTYPSEGGRPGDREKTSARSFPTGPSGRFYNDFDAKSGLKAAEEMFRLFQKKIFKGFRVGLIHGQMKRKEGEKVMAAFKDKEIDILIATTVVEVGVDVPNASVMVIEHAERFGLAQLHQLRGRIGRGTADSVCLLIAEPTTEEARQRLKAIVSTTDGFKIAQEDLMIRGPGHFFGRHQHGLNELKVANPATQLDILELARQEALLLTKQDPGMTHPDHQSIEKIIRRRYPTYLKNVEAG